VLGIVAIGEIRVDRI